MSTPKATKAQHEPKPAPGQRPGAPGGVRDRNRRRKNAALELTALRLFLAQGVASVTVDQIALGARMAKGSFYRYAEDKLDLVRRLVAPLSLGVRAAFDRCRAGLLESERASLPLVYLRLAAELTELVRDNPDAVRLYLQESRSPAIGDRAPITALATEVRVGAAELTDLATDLGLLGSTPAWLSTAVVVGAAEELLLEHLSESPARDPLAVQQALVRMVLHGITS